jgi:hypothetical protein
MPVCVGPSASAVHVAPTLTLNSSTNYNQNSGVLNATVATTGNRAITSVEFQWSTSSSFASGNSAWTVASTNTTIGQGTTGTARTVTATGLIENSSTGTTYYVRFRTTNSSGFVTTSGIGASFKTYKINPVPFTGSSTWTNPVPSSGTSGLAITGLLNLEARAGGASGDIIFGPYGGGGGGAGARTTASTASISGNVTVTIGGGGGYLTDLFGSPFWYPSNGNTTTIGSLLSATGGNVIVFSENGGSSGNGNAGGTGISNSNGGGGGGTNGAGGNASYSVGGAGGAGWTAGYGEGGKGGEASSSGLPTYGGAQTGNGGSGQNGVDNGAAPGFGLGGSGYAYFEYWGP